jgi:two-component system NtrC family sensor kinase
MSTPILVVDDSLTVRMDLAEALEAAGFRPVLCATGVETRAALAREQAALVILDVLLPDADGIDLLREIRESANADVPVMLLSTEAEVRDRIRGLRTGADEYIGKPYERSYVVSRVRELLGRRLGAAPPARAPVLVIDDSATFRAELGVALRSIGLEVVEAATGEQGLRLAADLRPAAVIVDGVMPGIDGATVIRHIRLDAALRLIPCLLLTGSEGQGAELRALDAGADAFARKEQDIGVVLARFTAMMRGAPARAALGPTPSLLGPKRLLAVDDSATYLHELADALHGEGYDVALAHSGEEAIELLAVQAVDCILLDVLMPGLDGKDTCARIKAAPGLRDIPLILLTALDERDSIIDGLGTGADDYVTKASGFDVLKARLRAQLRRKQLEDENRRIRQEIMDRELEAAEARAARELSETRAALAAELEHKNQELEAFSYSVSHDLRAPLRALRGFTQALLDECGHALGPKGTESAQHITAAAERMELLIEELLKLSRVGREPLKRQPVDLSALAREIAAQLQRAEPTRRARFVVAEGLRVEGDPVLLRQVLENLLGNAFKFSAHAPEPTIELSATESRGKRCYQVRDNGAGFDMAYAHQLFAPFRRLHLARDFPGTGIGLALVRRIVERHGGKAWAEGAVGRGATFSFTLQRGEDGA